MDNHDAFDIQHDKKHMDHQNIPKEMHFSLIILRKENDRLLDSNVQNKIN